MGGRATAYAASASANVGKGSLTTGVDKAEVKAGEKVHVTGRAKGLKVGDKVVLQHNKNGKWTTLKAGAVIKNGSSYAMDAKLNTKGPEELCGCSRRRATSSPRVSRSRCAEPRRTRRAPATRRVRWPASAGCHRGATAPESGDC